MCAALLSSLRDKEKHPKALHWPTFPGTGHQQECSVSRGLGTGHRGGSVLRVQVLADCGAVQPSLH